MQHPIDEPRALRVRSTLDKLSLALIVNAAANGAVAIALILDAWMRS